MASSMASDASIRAMAGTRWLSVGFAGSELGSDVSDALIQFPDRRASYPHVATRSDEQLIRIMPIIAQPQFSTFPITCAIASGVTRAGSN